MKEYRKEVPIDGSDRHPLGEVLTSGKRSLLCQNFLSQGRAKYRLSMQRTRGHREVDHLHLLLVAELREALHIFPAYDRGRSTASSRLIARCVMFVERRNRPMPRFVFLRFAVTRERNTFDAYVWLRLLVRCL